MKQVMLAFGISILVLTACKKESPEINIPNQNQEPIYKLPTKVGSYWVYQWYSIDANGVETALNQIDSLSIIGDSSANGNNYAIYRSRDFSGNKNIYLQRDSSGYIVTEHGQVTFKYVDIDTNTIYNSGSYSGLWDYYGRNLGSNFSVTVPVGTFQAFASEYYIYSQNGNPINNCGDMNHSFKTYHVSGIGVVQNETAYFSDFQSQCKKRVRRLINYYIPQ